MERRVKAGVILLGLGSFALSYERLHAVAISAGIVWFLALVYGALTEGFLTIATLAAFATRGTRATIYPWCVAGTAFGYSLWANAAPDTIPAGFVRAVPVIAVPLAVHLYIVIEQAQRAAASLPAPTVVLSPPVALGSEAGPTAAPTVPLREIDPTTLENPKLVGLRLLAHCAATPSAKSYYERQIRTLTAAPATA